MQKREIPIYKICHIRSPNDYKDILSERLQQLAPSETGAPRSAPVPVEEPGQEIQVEAGSSASGIKVPQSHPSLTISDNTLYVFFGEVEYDITEDDETRTINVNEHFKSDPKHEIFENIFSKYELNSIKETNINVVFLPERIYPDDSIETIKKKLLIHTRLSLRLTYGDLYMFCKQVKNLKSNHINDQLTSNGKMEITPIRIQNFLLNIDNHPREVVDYGGADLSEDVARQYTDFTKLGDPSPETGNYGYSNILNLKLEDAPRFMNVVMGQELSSVSHDYPYSVNPFDAVYMDPFLESHISEIINTTNKKVLLDVGQFLNNTIYLTTAEDVLRYTDSLSEPEVQQELGVANFPNARVMTTKYAIQLYFPYLAVFRDEQRVSLVERSIASSEGDADLTTIHSLDTLRMHREKLYEMDNKIMNENFMRQTSNVKLLYDIYERRTKEHQYIDDGIRGIELIIHPETKYNLSLDALFKKIHCDEDIPFIKLNPGKRLDNIYKLFTSGISKSGRKIPFLPKSDIFRLMKTCARKKSVAVYIHYSYLNNENPRHKATNLSIPVICEIQADGSIHVKTYFTFSFSVKEVNDIIIATVNPVLEVVKSYVEQSGYEMKLFKSFYDDNIDIVNIEYFAQLSISKNIEIKTMIKCISSVFNEIEGSLKKGILLRYKRVSNYNDMTSQEAYIVEMMNKRHTDREIIDGLRENYMLEEQDAKMKIAALLNSIQLQQLSRYRGGTIRIKNNPGFLTKITKGQFNNIISVEISSINNIMFLQILQMYIDSIIRIYQDPGSTDIPYSEIEKLCSGVTKKSGLKLPTLPRRLDDEGVSASAGTDAFSSESSDIFLQGSASAGPASSYPSDVQLSEDGGELRTFVQVSQNKAVTKEVNREDKEAEIDGVADITSSTRKPYTESVTSAIIGEKLVFGFEATEDIAGVAGLAGVSAGVEGGEDYDAFFGLIDEDESGGEEEQIGGVGKAKGDKAPRAQGGVVKPRKASSSDSSGDSDLESEHEDMSDITGMELANPNPFSKRIQERDPDIHLNEDVGKFNAYSRSCPSHYGRQPVIITDDEKARIDKEHPGSYSQSIKYGSNPKNQYNYICPRYWSLKHNTSLTEEEVKSGKYGKIIPHKSKKIPPGTNIFEFTDDKYHIDEKGNYKQHYPGFLKKDVHPKGLCVPCCFSQWDKPSQTTRREECELKQHEEIKVKEKQKGKKTASAAASATNIEVIQPSSIENPVPDPASASIEENPASKPLPPIDSAIPKIPNHSEIVKMGEIKDDRILSSDKFPLDNNRWGYLPIQIQKFLFTDNRNCQVSLKNTALKKDTPCLLRRGVEANDKQSFVSVIAYYYMEHKGKIKTSVEANIAQKRNPQDAKSMLQSKGNVMRNIIEESTASESGGKVAMYEPGSGKINSSKLLSMLTKTIEANAMRLKQQSGAVSVSEDKTPVASSPVVMKGSNIEASEISASGGVAEHYDSDDEAPIPMTPRAPGGAVASASSSMNSQEMLSDIVPTIRNMRNIIKESLDLDRFITLQNGTLVDTFYNSKNEIQERDIAKYKSSEIYKKLQTQQSPETTNVMFDKMCNAFENFISYLSDDDVIMDHTYLWDIVSLPNPKLFDNGNNIILINIPDDDITNNVQVICPTNSYSGDSFDPNRKTIIIMKRDKYYEPIYSFESKSNGKFNVLGRFAIKSKTIMPKIKHIIETIRDIYFSYCRLHASQPRQYKYVMNKPAKQIAKILKDSGFEILSQVMNYNGKVIGLKIKQTLTITKITPSELVKKSSIRKVYNGVIPTAPSAPITRSKTETNAGTATPALDSQKEGLQVLSDVRDNGIYEYPFIMMDDDNLWLNSYQEEVEFLNLVADHVKKMTKQIINCRPKVKVIEEGIVIGIITETNQFLQVNVEKDAQLNQDDGIPTVTEGNQLIAEKIITTQKHGSVDKVREKYVRNVRLETNFYNVFRNTARIIMNKPENKAIRDEIEKILNSTFMIYSNKLSKIIELMKRTLSKYVGFIKYSKETLKTIGEVSGCVYKDDKTCSSKKYCIKEHGGLCKLLLPQQNLMYNSIDNSIAYYGKLTDEIIRYERVKLFMFEPSKYLTFQETKYNLYDDEIILLESLITQEYFENLDPVDPNPFVTNTHFYTVNPNQNDGATVQAYDNMYRKGYIDSFKALNGVESGAGAGAQVMRASSAEVRDRPEAGATAMNSSGVELFNISEINHVLTFCNQVSKRKVTDKMQRLFFPRDTYEILFSNESEECSFDVMLTILRSVAQSASKCPSGHTCHRSKRRLKGERPAQSISASLEASADADIAAGLMDESAECKRCHSNIGVGETEFACTTCNYFVCDNCQHQHVDQLGGMNVTKIKEILIDAYDELSKIPTFDKKLNMILNGYGMKKYANLILEGKATFATVIQSENYFLTNVDIWILARYFKIPIVFVSQSLLIENGKNLLLLYGDSSIETYFFVHPFGVSQGAISRFALLELKVDKEHSVFRIPLSAGTKELQDIVAREIDADEPFTLERFITTFKISNIKNKPKQVFVKTTTETTGSGAVVDVVENEEDIDEPVQVSMSSVPSTALSRDESSGAGAGAFPGKPPLP
jgi:hypothetical protein